MGLKRGNFKCVGASVGVESQLCNLANVIQVVDPKLHQHLGTFLTTFLHFLFIIIKMLKKTNINTNADHLGGGDYLFAFRMLMVLFRRELSFGDSLYLWEVINNNNNLIKTPNFFQTNIITHSTTLLNT